MGIRYVCQKCGRQFKSPYYLAVHKKCFPIGTNSEISGSDLTGETFGINTVSIENVGITSSGLTNETFGINTANIEHVGIGCSGLTDADKMANSIDPDQTASLGAF